MGLYIAKSFAKQHGGNLYLSNSEKLYGAKVVLEISAKQREGQIITIPAL